MGKVIGIDLGTTNSCVAVLENDQPVVITNAEGSRTTPSVVAFTKNGERLVGDAARRQAAVNVDRTFFSIKREMGSAFRAKIDGKQYTPQEISAMILRKLKKDAEEYLGETVSDALEFRYQILRDTRIEIIPTEVIVSRGGKYFDEVVPDFNYRYVKCAATKIIHQNFLWLPVIQSVCQCRRCRLVDNPKNI